MQAHHRAKHGGIVVVRSQDIAQATRDHVGSPRAAQMAAAAHGVGRAQNDRVSGFLGRKEDTLVHGEFGHFRAKRPVIAARFRLAVIMAQHGRALGAGKGRDPVDMAGNVRPLRPDAGDERDKLCGGHMRPLCPVGHLAQKAVSGQVGDGVVRYLIEGAVVQGQVRMQQRRRGVVVESQRGPVRPGKDVPDQRFCFGAEGFPAQLDPVVCGQAGPQAFQRADNLPAGGDAAQARLPGQGQGMIGRGDTIGCQLAVGFQQGGLSIHGDAGAWHQLALKGIAVDIDEGRGQEPPGARHDCRAIACHIDARDQAVFDADRGSFNPVVQDQPCAFDQLCGHASFSARKCQCQLPGLS